MKPLAPLLLLAALLLVVPAQAQQIPFQGIAPVPMTAVGSTLVAKSSPGNLIAFLGTTGSTAGCFFVFNATSLPGNGSVTFGTAANNAPISPIQAAANTTISFSFPMPGTYIGGSGIVIGFSSTCGATLTASTTALITGWVQ